MIDFGKTVKVDKNIELNHKVPWKLGNHEDGYLIGLNNLINVRDNFFFLLIKYSFFFFRFLV